jgi:prefoldin subunit 5
LDYLTEVVDEDAIARAEADYTRKKAEITSKENEIDVKSKKLDAEIAALTQEMNSVQNLIQEGTKIFNQFHS